MPIKYVTIKLEGLPGSGKSIIASALRKTFAEAGIQTQDLKTLGGETIDHQFQVRLSDSHRKEIAKFGL